MGEMSGTEREGPFSIGGIYSPYSELVTSCRTYGRRGFAKKIMLEQSKLSSRPYVTVKGTRRGLLFLLDETCPYEKLEEGLIELLHNGSQLFSGPDVSIFVDYGTRDLSASESRRLLNIFLEQSNFYIKEWSSRTSARASLFANIVPSGQILAQILYRGTIRSGEMLAFEGDVVVLGNVNPGAHISATGDIYVFGKLQGIAHAGSTGNDTAVIAAVDFAPTQLRIADYVGYSPEKDGQPMRSRLEFAYVKNSTMAVDKLQFLVSFLQKRANEEVF